MSKAKRLRIFDRGAQAYARHTRGEIENRYACPLCLRHFGRDEAESGNLLTLEHVPPDSVGGRGLVLTCRECNSTAGTRVDAAAANLERLRRIARGIAGHENVTSEPARVTHFGETVNGTFEIDADAGVIWIDVQTERVNPSALERIQDAALKAADHTSEGPYHVTITPRIRFEPYRAQLSGFRAAYLLAFAALGYAFAADPRLEAVRHQIAHPDEATLPPFWLKYTGVEGSPLQVVHMTAPVEGLLIEVGGTPYLLPLPWSPSDFYEAVCERMTIGGSAGVQGSELVDPAELPMVLDFAQER